MRKNVEVVGIKSAVARMKNLSNYREVIKPILSETAQAIITHSRANIRTSTAPDSTPYRPIGEAAIAERERRKLRPPYTPLIVTGNMIRGMFARAIPNGIEFGAPQGYLVFHQQGSADNNRPPRRAIFPITKEGGIETQGKGGAFWRNFRDKLVKIA